MKNVADLVDMYEAVFGEPPSAMTRGSLLAMAHAFEITDNDPLGPLIVMAMRSTDLTAAALGQRSIEEQKHRERLRSLTGELDGLIDDLATARNRRWWWRLEANRYGRQTPDVRIDIHRRASPLLSYLGHALLGKNGVIDHDERVAAARVDLLLLTVVALTCVGTGAAIIKLATAL